MGFGLILCVWQLRQKREVRNCGGCYHACPTSLQKLPGHRTEVSGGAGCWPGDPSSVRASKLQPKYMLFSSPPWAGEQGVWGDTYLFMRPGKAFKDYHLEWIPVHQLIIGRIMGFGLVFWQLPLLLTPRSKTPCLRGRGSEPTNAIICPSEGLLLAGPFTFSLSLSPCSSPVN